MILSRPVAIGRTEVTFLQWEACVLAGGCGGRQPDDSGFGRGFRPVIDVDWHDAEAYVAWLRQSTGKPYRLPTEAEWEYACHAGTITSYPFGDASRRPLPTTTATSPVRARSAAIRRTRGVSTT